MAVIITVELTERTKKDLLKNVGPSLHEKAEQMMKVALEEYRTMMIGSLNKEYGTARFKIS